jgi:hypothetical protein
MLEVINMPQISLYVNKSTLEKIEKMAKEENISISKWVGKKIEKSFSDEYPPGYFELFGSIKDDSFKPVKKISFKYDSKRESL